MPSSLAKGNGAARSLRCTRCLGLLPQLCGETGAAGSSPRPATAGAEAPLAHPEPAACPPPTPRTASSRGRCGSPSRGAAGPLPSAGGTHQEQESPDPGHRWGATRPSERAAPSPGGAGQRPGRSDSPARPLPGPRAGRGDSQRPTSPPQVSEHVCAVLPEATGGNAPAPSGPRGAEGRGGAGRTARGELLAAGAH